MKAAREPLQHSTPVRVKSALMLDHVFDNVVTFERMELACRVVESLPDDIELPHVWWSELNNCHEFIWQRDEKILRAWILDGQIALYASFGREDREAIEDFDGVVLPPLLGELLAKAFRWVH